MKSNMVLLFLFIFCLLGAIFTFDSVANAIFFDSAFVLSFDIVSAIGLIFLFATFVFGTVFYIKFLKLQSFGNYLFFVFLPITLLFALFVYFLFPQTNSILQVIRLAARVTDNHYWLVGVLLLYLLVMFVVFRIATTPIHRLQKATSRLGDGFVKGRLRVGGCRQFRDMEFSLSKINQHYQDNIQKQKLDVEKYIPKQFLPFLGEKNVTDLNKGEQIQKEVTTMLCEIKQFSVKTNFEQTSLEQTSLEQTSLEQTNFEQTSLEQKFQSINAYLNLIKPLAEAHHGFVDKFQGEGLLIIFPKAENAIECSKSIFFSISNKNFLQKKMPQVRVDISIFTGETMLEVKGAQNKKLSLVVPNPLLEKMQQINQYFGSFVIFSSSTLQELSYEFATHYRYIGSISRQQNPINIFECLDVYTAMRREKLISVKGEFEEAVRLFELGNYFKAKNLFVNILKKIKEDRVSYVYFNLCDEKLNDEG